MTSGDDDYGKVLSYGCIFVKFAEISLVSLLSYF